MTYTYFRRYRMEFELPQHRLSPQVLPPEFVFERWHPDLIPAHAQAKYHSFRQELDTNVFPCLGDEAGCLRLMRDISNREGFLTRATWLIRTTESGAPKPVGTIQGIQSDLAIGAIQNIGIVPEFRGRGLGSKLILQSLWGFQQSGLERVVLEVTAQNRRAYKLYEQLGFRYLRTVYKCQDLVF